MDYFKKLNYIKKKKKKPTISTKKKVQSVLTEQLLSKAPMQNAINGYFRETFRCLLTPNLASTHRRCPLQETQETQTCVYVALIRLFHTHVHKVKLIMY